MSIAAGTPLGPYQILSPLGAGGMYTHFDLRDSRQRIESLGFDLA